MREAIGGTWIMGIVVFFIVLFSSYLAISVNYSKAFKVKNGIINIVEKHNGHNECAQKEIEEYLNNMGYYVYSLCREENSLGFNQKVNSSGGKARYRYCVESFNASDENAMPKTYYRIRVFFRLDLPIFSEVFTFSVTGESKSIYFPQEKTC